MRAPVLFQISLNSRGRVGRAVQSTRTPVLIPDALPNFPPGAGGSERPGNWGTSSITTRATPLEPTCIGPALCSPLLSAALHFYVSPDALGSLFSSFQLPKDFSMEAGLTFQPLLHKMLRTGVAPARFVNVFTRVTFQGASRFDPIRVRVRWPSRRDPSAAAARLTAAARRVPPSALSRPLPT